MEREVVFAERMEVCQNHPERSEIFWLEQMLIKAGHPYFFNFWEDLKPTPFNQDGGDPEKDIDWDNYNFLIEIGEPVREGLSAISVSFNTAGEPNLLELLDARPVVGKTDINMGYLHAGLTAEAAMEIIEEFFKTA